MSRKQSQKSIERILGEFPEARELYAPFRPGRFSELYPGAELDMHVLVQRADPNLMYWRPDNVSGRGRYLVDDERHLYGKRAEMCVFYGHDEQRVALLGMDTEVLHKLFARDSLYKRVGSIITMSETLWFDKVPTEEGAWLGALKRFEVTLTIYKQPNAAQTMFGERSGWEALAEETDVYRNVKLYGPLMFPHPDLNASWYRELVVMMSERAKMFERFVWSRGFGKIVDDSKSRGMSGMFGDITVMSYVLAGRVQVQLERGGIRFTMIAQDEVDDPRMAVNSLDGTVDEITALVDDAATFWLMADDATRTSCYHDDGDVNIGF